ncbi:hypothetical protein C8R46DRAFT_648539 [Mycena filopes]|nr:hypothetical protein C8R46DRAFT_648539 [Mycena filopes]
MYFPSGFFLVSLIVYIFPDWISMLHMYHPHPTPPTPSHLNLNLISSKFYLACKYDVKYDTIYGHGHLSNTYTARSRPPYRPRRDTYTTDIQYIQKRTDVFVFERGSAICVHIILFKLFVVAVQYRVRENEWRCVRFALLYDCVWSERRVVGAEESECGSTAESNKKSSCRDCVWNVGRNSTKLKPPPGLWNEAG